MHPARSKPSTTSRDKAQAARAAALTLPPPVLPPANESFIVTPARAVGKADAADPAPSESPGQRALGPREACAGQEPGNVAACVKRLCDNDPRYARFPVCLRVHRVEEQPQ